MHKFSDVSRISLRYKKTCPVNLPDRSDSVSDLRFPTTASPVNWWYTIEIIIDDKTYNVKLPEDAVEHDNP